MAITTSRVVTCLPHERAGQQHARARGAGEWPFHNPDPSSTACYWLSETAGRVWDTPSVATDPRFLTLTDVAEVLNVSAAQVYALVRSGELISLKVGGRGQYRVERDDLEAYIARMKARTAEFITEHPLTRDEPDQPEDPDASDQPD